MLRYDPRTRVIACGFAALAGFVDAIGFLGSGGFFVSFMSGNSTRLAVGVAGRLMVAATAGGLILAFVLGVVSAALIARGRKAIRQRIVMTIVSSALFMAAMTADFAAPFVALPLVAFAMGALNMMFERDGEIRIGLTYMTGTLVKIGQHLAVALSGGERWGWVPFLSLWLGLIAGTIAGALSHRAIGLDALWVAAAASVTMALLASRPLIAGEASHS
ncbi:MAG: YoaK family protein [Sphingomicrobium sp.]